MNFYAVIPSAILVNHEILAKEKILYGIITSTTDKEGYCYDTNAELATYFRTNEGIVHTKTVSRWINNLAKLGYITSEVYMESGKQKRKIKLSDKIVVYTQKTIEVEQKTKTVNVGTNDDTILEIITYLNKLTGKRFSPTTKVYKQAITKLINNGSTLEDFRKVIEAVSVNDWYVKNPQYFVPTTVFREDKFQSHLAAWTFELRQSIYTSNESLEVADIDVSTETF